MATLSPKWCRDCQWRSPYRNGQIKNGMFTDVRADSMSCWALVKALACAWPVWCKLVEDVIWGCVNQTLEQGMNIGRQHRFIGWITYHGRSNGQPSMWFINASASHRSSTKSRPVRWCVHYRRCWAWVTSAWYGILVNPGNFKYTKASNMMGLTRFKMLRTYESASMSRITRCVWCRIHIAVRETCAGRFKQKSSALKAMRKR